MRSAMRNEVHICNAPNGHVNNVDCWCEPVNIQWVRNKHGVDVLVIEHVDDTLQHRIVITAERERDRNAPYENKPDNGWITRALTPPWSPPLLPPHDPNERSV